MLTEETTPRGVSTYSPQRMLQTLRQRMWTIVVVAVVTAGSALGFSVLQTPTYEASVTDTGRPKDYRRYNYRCGGCFRSSGACANCGQSGAYHAHSWTVVERLNLPEERPEECSTTSARSRIPAPCSSMYPTEIPTPRGAADR